MKNKKPPRLAGWFLFGYTEHMKKNKKIQFDIITIFPDAFDSYISQSIIGRAVAKKYIDVRIHNLRDFTTDKHHKVDDRPYGGGAGMVFKVEPIYKALKKIRKKNKKSHTILFAAKGIPFTQKKALDLVRYDQIILICGHYEGVDERVAQYLADEEISIGPYVLTGGEIPALAILDSVTRLVPGVINPISLEEESFSQEGASEYPQYTRPEEMKLGTHKAKVPAALLSGNHAQIQAWRKKHSTQQ